MRSRKSLHVLGRENVHLCTSVTRLRRKMARVCAILESKI